MAPMYFALAAIVMLGTLGIKKEMKMPEPVSIDPHLYSQEERDKLGIVALPLTFKDRKAAVLSE